jgi:hypothetical protein
MAGSVVGERLGFGDGRHVEHVDPAQDAVVCKRTGED